MLRLLRLIIFGVWKYEPRHEHAWKKINRQTIRVYRQPADKCPAEIYEVYFLRCKTCGEYKTQRFRLSPDTLFSDGADAITMP